MLIVEDGTGLSNADSYVSLSFIDEYESKYKPTPSWGSATSAVQEIAARVATQYVDVLLRQRVVSSPLRSSQALVFPRQDGMPLLLLQATAEAALRAVSEPLLVDVEANNANVQSLAQRFAVFAQTVTYSSAGRPQQTTYTIVRKLLEPFIWQGVERG